MSFQVDELEKTTDASCKDAARRLSWWATRENNTQFKKRQPLMGFTIGGIPLAELTSEQLEQTSWNHLPADELMQTLEENHKAILNASQFEIDPEKEQTQMEDLIFPDEIAAIRNMKTWAYAQEIFQGGEAQMFRMAGEVIKVCADKSKPVPPTVSALDGFVEFHPKADMFLNNGTGKYFVTFDPPFVLKMHGNGTNVVNDVPGTCS